MADIARLAGVSTSTVSRALSHSPLVNQETRDRILDLARSLNYTINIGAQNLRLQQNRTVAVVIPIDQSSRQQLSDPFFLSMLGSLADALSEQGFDTLVSRVDADQVDAAAAPFDGGRAIGVILIGQGRHHDQLNKMAARGVPFVVWGAQLPQQLYTTVGGDNITGGRLATERLLAQGRRRIAFLGHATTHYPEFFDRYRGHERALLEARVPTSSALQVDAITTEDAGFQALRELERRGVEFDAVVAASDLIAIGALRALQESGIDVPREVSVVGFDDIPAASHTNPPLTTVVQDTRRAGDLLVETLLRQIAGDPAANSVIPTRLVVRKSG